MSASLARTSLRVALTLMVLLLAGCGAAAVPASPAASATSLVTASPATTPAPASATPAPSSQPPVTAEQSVSIAKKLFPLSADGTYLECDASLTDTAACPFSARLQAQIATYVANYKRLCPQGCGGALLLLRQQCGGFRHESVTTAPNPAVAIVSLSGNDCLGGSETMYVQVILEGSPVADDVDCNIGDPKYGMYNPDPNATGGMSCGTPSS